MEKQSFIWCTKKERMVAPELCPSCITRGCPNKPKPTKLVLQKQERDVNMYIGVDKNGALSIITIVDFKNPTKEELDGVVKVFVIKDEYVPVYKVVLEQRKKVEEKNSDVQKPKRKRGAKQLKE